MLILKLLLISVTVFVSEVSCQEVNEDIEVLGDVEGPRTAALVDGEVADQGEHPWHVGLVREESKTGFLGWVRHLGGLIRTTTFCGASLVSRRWLLTAAHCIRPQDRPVDLRVVMGSSKRALYFYYFFQTDSISEIVVHPEYNTEGHAYDIALLRLKKQPELSRGELWPVCMPVAPVASYAGQPATVVGWGRTEGKQGSSARYLQELEVEVISQSKCQEQWGYGRGRVEVGGPKMCFKSKGASCHGDSGGGMFLRDGNRHELIGVCSYGLSDCKNWAPEVYTKVSFVMDWITKTIGATDPDDALNIPQCGMSIEVDESTSRGGRSQPLIDWIVGAASG